METTRLFGNVASWDTRQLFTTATLFALGAIAFILAVREERRMHRFRQPGITYSEATLRRDGGWRRTDLFTPEGLVHQRRASRYGVTGASLWIAALGAWVALG
jgi:hypothetical protein